MHEIMRFSSNSTGSIVMNSVFDKKSVSNSLQTGSTLHAIYVYFMYTIQYKNESLTLKLSEDLSNYGFKMHFWLDFCK